VAVATDNGTRPVQFGIFEVDLRAGELRRNGARVKLQEQPFQILSTLLERPGQVVTREELQRKLWPADTFVDFDHSLNAAIRRLRDALGDSAENPRYVETVARRGYRFLIPVNGARALIVTQPTRKPGVELQHWTIFVSCGLLLVLGVGWLIVHGRHQPIVARPGQIKHRRLTANPNEDPVLGAVISPNGKYLAFSDTTGFYLRQIDSGETHSLNLPPGLKAVPAAWYPDGTHLLASWAEGPKAPPSLWEVSILGGTARKLIEDGRLPAVSRDGSQIAFVKGPKLAEELWVVAANGENPRRLVATQMCTLGEPAWSPDGRRIAYVMGSYAPEQWQAESSVVLFDLDSGQQETIFSTASSQAPIYADMELGPGLVWTPDNHLVYSLSEAPPNQSDSNVWSIPLDSHGRVVGTAQRLTATPDEVSALSASADSKRIAYTKNSLSPVIYVAETDSGGKRLGPLRRLTLDNWRNYPFSWTPDSKAVLVASDRDGTYHIFKQQIDRTVSEELLVGGSEEVMLPRLAPDNSTVLYETWPKSGESVAERRLMRVSLAGGPAQTVLRQDAMGNMQCARAPSTLCLYDARTTSEVLFFSFNPATGHKEELPQLRIRDEAPYAYNWSLSPDGKTLATAKGKVVQKDPSVTFYSVSDGSKRTVTAHAWAGISSIDFAADGRSLWAPAYTNDGKWALLNIDLQGRTRIVLEDTNMTIGWAIPAPDGHHLALWEARGNSNVWMLECF
jgi:DNA-binding winged helix-turn-helix (wHTH) protein/Tol biopolymer transport system component